MAGGVISNLTYAVGFKIAGSALKKADKQTDALTQKVIGLGKAAAGVGIAIGGIGITAMGFASRFEDAMSKVQMATGATNEQMVETKGIATDLYNQNFGDSWADLGQSIATVQQVTGTSGEALQDLTRDALLLRDAFGFDVTESISASKKMMDNFGISGNEAFSLIAQGKQKGLDFSGELMGTLDEYSSQFHALGFSANEMFDTLAAGSAEGAFNLDKVADAVKEFSIRSIDSSKTTNEAFEMLGLNASDMMQTFARGGPGAKKSFQQIVSMVGDIADPVAQNTVAVSLFGTQFEDLKKDVLMAMGTAGEQFDMTKDKMGEINQVKMDSPGQAIAEIGRQFETGIVNPIGDLILPYLSQFSDWFRDSLPQMQSIAADAVSAVGDIFSGLGDAVKWVTDHMDTLLPIVAGLTGAIVAQMIISKLTSLHKAWQAATVAQTTVQWLLNTALNANPFGMVALAIGALIGVGIALWKNWDTVWAVTKRVFTAIGDFFAEYWPYALELLLGPLGKLIVYVIQNFDEIKDKIWNTLKSIGTFFSDTWNGIFDFLGSINLAEVGMNIIQGLINGIMGMKDAVVGKVKEVASGIKNGIKDFLGIHSPSRVMMEVGFYTGEGLALGLDQTSQRVTSVSENIAEKMVPEIRQPDIPEWSIPKPDFPDMPKWPQPPAYEFTPKPIAFEPPDMDVPTGDVPSRQTQASAAAPASLPTARGNGGGQTIEVHVSMPITIQGNADAKTVTKLERMVDERLQTLLESAARQLGVSVLGTN